MALLKAFGIYENYNIPSASSLYFELHEDMGSKKYFVNVYLDHNEIDISDTDHQGSLMVEKLHNLNGTNSVPNVHVKNTKAGAAGGSQFKIPLMITDQVKTNENDEPDMESSRYDYFKRSLMNRIIAQSTESYCEQSLSQVEFFASESE